MTPNLPNIKMQLLEYVVDCANGPFDAVNLREFATQRGYEEHRVANKVHELNVSHDETVLGWGVSPMHVWYEDVDTVQEVLNRYD